MIRRTLDPLEVILGTDQVSEEFYYPFDAGEWLLEEENIALVNDRGDVALLEAHGSPHVYKGHYFFQSRGKEAVLAAREFLSEAFSLFGVDRIMGYTPLRQKGAMWLTRRLGFTPLCIETIYGEDNQVWTMHKKDFQWVSV